MWWKVFWARINPGGDQNPARVKALAQTALQTAAGQFILFYAQRRQDLDFAFHAAGQLRLGFVGISRIECCRLRSGFWSGDGGHTGMAAGD
jgi:hypothetical protein